MPTSNNQLKNPESDKHSQLGERLENLRQRRGLSLSELSALTGISRSSLYKVENSGMSLTYSKLIDLAHGLDVKISELFEDTPKEKDAQSPAITARMVRGRHGEGYAVDTEQYDATYLCPELKNKKLLPMYGVITARSIDEIGALQGHQGEEFTYVIEGSIELHTEYYEPLHLDSGDHVYLDSTMPHAFVSVSERPAKIITVCTSPDTD